MNADDIAKINAQAARLNDAASVVPVTGAAKPNGGGAAEQLFVDTHLQTHRTGTLRHHQGRTRPAPYGRAQAEVA
jgi:hypothetical protein